MKKFIIIMRVCNNGLSLIIFDVQFAVTAIFVSKSYNFDQNRIFMAKFNVTSKYQLENITLNDIKAEFAETAIFVSKCYITYRNQFFVPEFEFRNTANLYWRSLSILSERFQCRIYHKNIFRDEKLQFWSILIFYGRICHNNASLC